MKTFGLLGSGIGYSLSPVMHNAAFAKLGMDAEYVIFDIPQKKVDSFLNGILRSEVSGLNVTVPYKITAYQFIKKYGTVDRETDMLGAVNTIVIKNKSLFGYNTDPHGFIRSLSVDLGFVPRMKSVFIYGAGGAGTALAVKLARVTDKIYIFDIDTEKIKTFLDRFFRYFGREKLVVVENSPEEIRKAIKSSQLIVNATPYGRREGELLVSPGMLHNDLSVYDLIYSPMTTPIVDEARKMGLKAANGLGMLLYQGARAFELWTGKKAPVSVMKQALVEAISNSQQK